MSELDSVLSGNSGEKFKVDFSGASEDNDFSTPLDPGEYQAVIDSVESGTIKSGANEGKPKLVWVFKVSEGPRKGKNVWAHLGTTGNTFRNRQIIKAAGIEGDEFVKADVVNKPVTLVIGESKDGYDNLLRVLPPASAASDILG